MNVRSFVSSFAVAMLLFIVSVTMIGAVLISYEEKQFNTYANNLAKTKQKVILLGLLTEAQLAQYENFSIEQIEVLTDFSFQDAIYALKPYKNLDYVETVARKALHQAEAHLSNVYDREDAILYFRSYTSDKLILERPIPALEGSKETFDIEWCRVNYACILAAGKSSSPTEFLSLSPSKPRIQMRWH